MTAVGLIPARAQRFSVDAALHTAEKPYVQATGEATLSAMPDQAVVEIGVASDGATSAGAAEQNARQTDLVLTSLGRLLGAGRRIKTTSYSVRPNYEYALSSASAKVKGYRVTNIVEVTLDDLTQVTSVIDTAIRSGANVVQKLEYRLKNRSALERQALRDAAEQAKARAEAIASGLGVRVVRVVSAEEVTSEEGFAMHKVVPPPPPTGTVPSTPVEVGAIEVGAGVIVRAEIGE